MTGDELLFSAGGLEVDGHVLIVRHINNVNDETMLRSSHGLLFGNQLLEVRILHQGINNVFHSCVGVGVAACLPVPP